MAGVHRAAAREAVGKPGRSVARRRGLTSCTRSATCFSQRRPNACSKRERVRCARRSAVGGERGAQGACLDDRGYELLPGTQRRQAPVRHLAAGDQMPPDVIRRAIDGTVASARTHLDWVRFHRSPPEGRRETLEMGETVKAPIDPRLAAPWRRADARHVVRPTTTPSQRPRFAKTTVTP